MKKTFLLILSLVSASLYAQEPVIPTPADTLSLSTRPNNHDLTTTGGGKMLPRTPVYAPCIGVTSHTLLLYSGCDNAEIVLTNYADEEVYSTIVPEGTPFLVLPEWLSGQYELHIHRGNFCFWGLIEL